jgi:hypothetical protein
MRDLIRLRSVVREIVTARVNIFKVFRCVTAASTGKGRRGEWLTDGGYRLGPSNILLNRSHFRAMSMPL